MWNVLGHTSCLIIFILLKRFTLILVNHVQETAKSFLFVWYNLNGLKFSMISFIYAGISSGWLKIKTQMRLVYIHCMLFHLPNQQSKPLKQKLLPNTLILERWRQTFLMGEQIWIFKVLFVKDCRYFYSLLTCMIQRKFLTWLKDQSSGGKRFAISLLITLSWIVPFELCSPMMLNMYSLGLGHFIYFSLGS